MEPDPAQERVVAALQTILDGLRERALARKGNALGWLFNGGAKARAPVRGLYIHGAVGRGKTMLMDLFFAEVPAQVPARRVHFHAFMTDVHERIFRHRNDLKAGRVKGEDPIPPVAADLFAEANLLCLDEFSVTDIADAMLLGRLFSRLFELGMVVVATSNVDPSRLYEDGLNRALFLPFITLMQQQMDIIALQSPKDYRLSKLSAVETWCVTAETTALDEAFRRLTGGAPVRAMMLTVKGRTLEVPIASMGVARLSFDALCRRPLGASDYLALAEAFHTLVLDGVPVMGEAERNEARRFITLIDTLYDRGVKLVASAAAEPAGLYTGTDGPVAFEFQRTVSRLTEMRSTDYLGRPHGRQRGSTTLVET